MLAFVFPGQGSQKKGMGEDLFNTVPEFIDNEHEINDILGYSLRELCLLDGSNLLNQTQYTQPCLYTINALYYYKAKREGARPEYLAGHSLGEYNALLAAGAFDFLTGLRLVQKRGQLMSLAKNGAMAAVIGLESQRIRLALQRDGLSGIDVANFNSPSQTVISGPTNEIEQAVSVLDRAGAQLCVPLPVSAAFHSRYMDEAGQEFSQFLKGFSFNPLKTPVVANVTGDFYPDTHPNSTIVELLTRQISESVQWVKSIQLLKQKGVSEFKEQGPGIILTGLIRQIFG